MATTTRTRRTAKAKTAGLGFNPIEARHGFLVEVPKGKSKKEWISVGEYRNVDLTLLDGNESSSTTQIQSLDTPNDNDHKDPNLRVLIDRARWLELAPAFFEEANRRLRANGFSSMKFQKNPSKPIPIHPSLGKELCVLCWAVEEAPIDLIPNAIMNWEALAPEERWWLYTMTVATTGQAVQRGVGWRKGLRAALAENPFVKGEGSSPRARRELLGHAQLTLDLD